MYNFDPYNVLLSIATNIPVLLMTAFVLQGHIWECKTYISGTLPFTALDVNPAMTTSAAEKHVNVKKHYFNVSS